MNNPVRFIDPTGMIPENPNPDSFWHRVTWSGARRNAQRYANAKSDLGYESQVYKNSDVWSVRGQKTRDDGTTSTTSHYAASYDNNGEVYSKSWSLTTQSPEPVPMDYASSGDATISSPSPFQGKSNFDIVMVDTNPIMPAIASAVVPPLGFIAGTAQTINDASECNYFGAAIGVVSLGLSAKMSGPANQWFRGADNKFSLTPGNTFSKTLDQGTVGFKWGASPIHLNKIPSPGMQKINQMIRRTSLPVSDNLGLREAGHYHLRTR
ncbi:hypothetical protein OK18_14620 [Chryseobacterium gallinarum]|uniref:RHS repeat-associated core domain-containing protein n=1 Tax=Chryseobacterium gallinarum TaxID=1324352 RepID=A0A0G3M3C3_CHRGL|nr:hypothetical protein OK18_14620 [Chryseobacterium gallinarum]